MVRVRLLSANVSGIQVFVNCLTSASACRSKSTVAAIGVKAGAHSKSERPSHFEGVHDVEVMRPRLGKILPRMSCSVAAYEPLLPIGRGAVGVMLLKGLTVILTFIAE